MFLSKKTTTRATSLFSGVSAAAMLLGLSAGTARAAGTTITNTVTSVSVTTASSLDFIDIDGGTVTNDVTNNGTVGLPTTFRAIEVHGLGVSIGGSIINGTSGLILASGRGISVSQFDPVDNIQNLGAISVQRPATGTATNAVAGGIFYQGFVNLDDLNSTIVNEGTISVGAQAVGPNATAGGDGINQNGFNVSNGAGHTIKISATNSGLIDGEASATGSSLLIIISGIDQDIILTSTGIAGDLTIEQTNMGSIEIEAQASGTGSARGRGMSQGVFLFTNSTSGDVNVSANNSQLIDLNLEGAGSNLTVTGSGIFQFNSIQGASNSGDANFSASNSGTINLNIENNGVTSVVFADGIRQLFLVNGNSVAGNSIATVSNPGDIEIGIVLNGVGANGRVDGISAFHSARSTSTAGDVDLTLNNSGSVLIDFSLNGDNGFGSATGAQQQNFATSNSTVGNVTLTANNSGNVDINFQGMASGTGTQNVAARAFGFRQTAVATSAGTINFNVTNTTSGNLNVGASATAVGTSSAVAAQARARATGIFQNINPINQLAGNYNFSNSGSLNVGASANASGGVTSNSATATAVGFRAGPVSLVTGGGGTFLNGSPNQIRNLNVNNNGSVNVSAVANAANAVANAFGFIFQGATLSGTVSNGGTVSVSASAPGAAAQAVGFAFNGDRNVASFSNTGDINVLAIGSTTATGVRVAGSGIFTNTVTIGTTDAFTFTNNGGSIKAQVNSGGTLGYGNAINTLDAPNPVIINLEGGGDIFGNILISDDDDIFVQNGLTFFDGMINGTTTLVGDLSVRSGGTLSLQVGVVSTEANIYVDTYTQTSTGTLSYTITPQTTILGQINAKEANLAGTVNVNLTPGLYGNMTTFTKVINASTLNGTWDNVTTNTNSAFLSLAAQYPGDGTANLVLTRNAFNSLGGLTINQNAAATGIENSYNVNLTGPYGMLVQDLLFMDGAAFTAAVEQLHGAEHAQNLRSLLWSFDSLNNAISDRVNVGPYGNRDNNGDIIQRGDISFWARASLGWGDNDGDVEASGFDQDINAYHAGFDLAVSSNAIIGFAAGYYKNELEFDNGNTKQDDGVQFAVYGHYDIKDWYLRGVIGYGIYDSESRRAISVGSTAGTALGVYDIDVFSLNGEFGRRFEVNPGVFVTPFAAFDYADVEMDAFSETGAGGANLVFPENSISAWSADIGARFSTAVEFGNGGLLIPEVSVAYSHDFGDERITLNTGFAAANSGFQVISSHVGSDSVLVNAGLTLATTGGIEIRGEYNGRFNSDYKINSVSIRLSLLFGGN